MASVNPIQTFQYRGINRTSIVPPCVVTLADLRRLYAELERKAIEARERHCRGIVRPLDAVEADFEQAKVEFIRDARLTLTVLGSEGEQIVSRSVEALDSESLPLRINLIVFDSAAAAQAVNVPLMNRFKLSLDFTEPTNFDTHNPWSEPTPNRSTLEVVGNDSTWVTGVHESTMSFLKRYRRRRKWLHSQRTFNFLNYAVGLPAAFWCVYRIDQLLPVVTTLHPVLRAGIYVYLFMMITLLFRIAIRGLRWILPVVELEGARSWKARAGVWVVLSAVMLGLLKDVIKTLFYHGN